MRNSYRWLLGWCRQWRAALLAALLLAFSQGVVGADDLTTLAQSATTQATSFGDVFKTLMAVSVVLALAAMGAWAIIGAIRNRNTD
jgi:hypothetical protein